MIMVEKSIIIIGAGLGGLATGCYAQMNGFSSQIFEQHLVPGGLAAAWKRKGYLIDGGIHFVYGHKPGIALYKIFQEIGADEVHYVDMTTYTRFVDEPSNLCIEITNDLGQLRNELITLFPEDKKIINELLSGAQSIAKRDLSDVGFQKPVELMRWRDKIGEMWSFRGLWRYMIGKFAKPVKEYVRRVHDPILREILMYMFLPDVPVWFIQMILGMLAAGQMGIIKNGCHAFVQAIEKHYLDLGGKVTYNTSVEEILVKNNQAIGIQLADGSHHKADYVVSAADGYHTIYELLTGRYVNEEIETRYRIWKLTSPILLISFGVAREFKEEPWMILRKLDQPLRVVDKEINYIMLRIFNYSTSFAPPGKTVVQVYIETDWINWTDLREDKQKYKAEKEHVAAEVLQRLEKYYPGISSEVEVTDVATPISYWRYTRNREGSIMGWPPTPESMTVQVKKTLPGLKNFYMAGQWSMATGGVSPTIYSGRHVIQLICHQEGKPFKTI